MSPTSTAAPRTYPYTPARHDYGPGLVPRAILVHMAEGGGTVGYLHRAPRRGVSVHFVVEHAGQVVQMLPLDHVSGSANPALIRGLLRRVRPNDAPFVGYDGETITYGSAAARAVLGDGWRNPNRYCVSVEVEGWASDRRVDGEIIPGGPNRDQRNALRRLYLDLRRRLPTLRGALGHRDLQAYKACPGRFIPWASLGGHGVWKE